MIKDLLQNRNANWVSNKAVATFRFKIAFNLEYLHSDIDAIERVDVLRRLRMGESDALVGVNLLREGLDVPEVSLVCILDADKEGFLRSSTSLIQTAGRAARHENGRVILYADKYDGLAENGHRNVFRPARRAGGIQRIAQYNAQVCHAPD